MVLAGALALVTASAAQERPAPGLTAAPEVARVYDAIFDARFDDVPPLAARACALREPQGTPGTSRGGPAPREACQVLEAVAAWWRIQIDPLNTSRDEAFRSQVDEAIAATTAWTVREPQRAEAWFYLGGACAARVQWRVLRGQRLAAARDGRRIKEALERALALDPAMSDAYFGLGLYHYYADVAPAFLKMLRWILLLPGGDREQGLEEMLRARRAGLLVRGEADYQLHLVYLWYEKQPLRALELLADLQARHPRNPHFWQAAADIQDVYLSDVHASLQSWQALLEAARERRVEEPEMADAAARLGIARQLDRLSQPEPALEHLRAVITARPSSPFGAVARAHLQRGRALEHLGRRTDAAAAYRDAIAAAGPGDPLKVAAAARAALRAMRR